MKLVRENIEFKRGQKVTKALDVGVYQYYKDKEDLLLQELKDRGIWGLQSLNFSREHHHANSDHGIHVTCNLPSYPHGGFEEHVKQQDQRHNEIKKALTEIGFDIIDSVRDDRITTEINAYYL